MIHHDLTHPLDTKNNLRNIYIDCSFFPVAEPAESSGSAGVNADSTSSCDHSSVQPENQNDSFNQLQCVEYLRSGKKKFFCLFL